MPALPHLRGSDRRPTAVLLAFCCALLAMVLVPSASSAQTTDPDAAQLDPSFGGNGRVVTDFPVEAWDVAIQPDGKVLVGGGSWALPPTLERFNPDGSLDPGFGDAGRVYAPVYISELTLQPDGRIVTAGWAWGDTGLDFGLARYHPDGRLDTSFGGDGTVTTDFPASGYDQANAVAIQPDGKIIAGGIASTANAVNDRDPALARYNADGSLDLTFDGDGMVTTPDGPVYSEVRDLAIQPDGRIVAVVSGSGLFRYRADGSLDASFGLGGNTTASGNRWGHFESVSLQADGRMVAGG